MIQQPGMGQYWIGRMTHYPIDGDMIDAKT